MNDRDNVLQLLNTFKLNDTSSLLDNLLIYLKNAALPTLRPMTSHYQRIRSQKVSFSQLSLTPIKEESPSVDLVLELVIHEPLLHPKEIMHIGLTLQTWNYLPLFQLFQSLFQKRYTSKPALDIFFNSCHTLSDIQYCKDAYAIIFPTTPNSQKIDIV